MDAVAENRVVTVHQYFTAKGEEVAEFRLRFGKYRGSVLGWSYRQPQPRRKSVSKPFHADFVFDGTSVVIDGQDITVTDGDASLTLTAGAGDLVEDAFQNAQAMVRSRSCDRWTADRIVYCFGLAARRIAQQAMEEFA